MSTKKTETKVEEVKTITVIVLKKITTFDNTIYTPVLNKEGKPVFDGVELPTEDYHHFEEHDAVKAYISK